MEQGKPPGCRSRSALKGNPGLKEAVRKRGLLQSFLAKILRVRVIPRSEWGARYGNGNDVSSKMPWGEVVIHTEAGALRPSDWKELEGKAAEYAAWNAALTEKQKLQAIERFHVIERGWQGIAYSFFITFDGSVFEGRGWGRSGAHTEGRNSTAAGVCFQGHGDLQPATEAQWGAAWWLIQEGVRLGHLTKKPKVSGHRDYSLKGKTCPGNLIYPQLHRLRSRPPQKDWFDMATEEELNRVVTDAIESALAENSKAQVAQDVRTLKRHLVVGADVPEGSDPVPRRIIDSQARVEAELKAVRALLETIEANLTTTAADENEENSP